MKPGDRGRKFRQRPKGGRELLLHREGLPPLEQYTQRVRSFMSLRPTQPSRGHDAGSQSAAQAASVPVVTTAGAAPQGPHVSAPSSGGQASGNKGPGASGAAAAAGPVPGGGSRKRELAIPR